jgi:transposase
MDEITNYFISRPQRAAPVEGWNNRIKARTRRCYGLTNIPNCFRRLRLDLHGFEEFAR